MDTSVHESEGGGRRRPDVRILTPVAHGRASTAQVHDQAPLDEEPEKKGFMLKLRVSQVTFYLA